MMRRKAIALGLLVILWIGSVIAMLLWPITYLWRGNEVFRTATQAVNALLGGYSRESLSSRMGRTGEFPSIREMVDKADPDHCYKAALKEAPVVAALQVKP